MQALESGLAWTCGRGQCLVIGEGNEVPAGNIWVHGDDMPWVMTGPDFGCVNHEERS